MRRFALEKSPIRIVVVDDAEAWRRFFRSTLQNVRELQVICEVSDGLAAVQQAQELQPDMILLDIGLPRLNGIEAARRIREVSPGSKILFVTENTSWDVAQEALRSGGSGYVVKSNAASELLPALKAVLLGKPFLSFGLTDRNLICVEHEGAFGPARYESIVRQSTSQSLEITSREVRLYLDDAGVVDSFASSIAAVMKNGDRVVVTAPQSQRAGILQKLSSDGVDVAAAIEQKRYVSLDAVHTRARSLVEASSSACGFANVPHAMEEAMQTAKEQHLRAAFR